MRKLFANLICLFVPDKKLRHEIRAKLKGGDSSKNRHEIYVILKADDSFQNRHEIRALLKADDSSQNRHEIHVMLKADDSSQKSMQACNNFIPAFGVIGNKSWIRYMLENDMREKVAALRHGLDAESNATIDRFFQYMTILPENWWGKYNVLRDFVIDSRATATEEIAMKVYESELKQYHKDYILDEDGRCPDVFLAHTGLSQANQKIWDYIANKDFIDGGAYIGDSALVYIKKYNPNKVWSFEISSGTAARYQKIMSLNSIEGSKYELVLAGLSDKKSTIRFNDDENMSTSLENIGDSECTLIDTDWFAKTNNLKVGFIKCDVEGMGLDALAGMKETIRRDRPVLTLAMYHGPVEFFETKPLLDEIVKDLNYTITIKKYHPYPDMDIDICIFAYPRELE